MTASRTQIGGEPGFPDRRYVIALELSEAHIRADVSGIRAEVPGG